jgi:hypothetical protein
VNVFANGSIFSAWDKQLQQLLAGGPMLLAAACAYDQPGKLYRPGDEYLLVQQRP